MVKDIVITVTPANVENSELINSLIKKEMGKVGIHSSKNVETVFVKKSVDARHGKVKIHLKYKCYIDESPLQNKDDLPKWEYASGKSVIIVGAGPAGLFGALKLLEKGIKPIIIDRGDEAGQRKRDIAMISTKGVVNPNSNYCFGEGGAGTFSDGKLYCRSKKRGNINNILRIFNYFGADDNILTDAHPHIGTDKLPIVIGNMRKKIQELGGEIHFNTRLYDFIIEDNCVKGITCLNTKTGQESSMYADAVVLAAGHSANDVYNLISMRAPKALEAKTFAMGLRVEHPRELIDKIQYHGKTPEGLGAAEYRLTTQVNNRGVYSFCMCPGGFVVPSSSGPDEIVVNGMSAAARNSKWSNSALVVEIRPEDIPAEFVNKATEMGCPAMAGLYYRYYVERLAKKNGDGQAAPAQRITDFIANRISDSLPASSYTPGLISSNLISWLPNHISSRLVAAFNDFNRSMNGFVCNDGVLIAIESRTSTPVRILRNKDTFECVGLGNLYAAGEGCGYAGGIVSSAMDGENCCSMLMDNLLKQ